MDGQTIIQLISAVGFPAAFAVVIFIAYEKRGPQSNQRGIETSPREMIALAREWASIEPAWD
jgi:hypothetical protein